MNWTQETLDGIKKMAAEGRAKDTTPTSAAKAADVSDEKAFLSLVRGYARDRGWLTYHTHDSRKSEAGFPDLCMVRTGRMIFAELKVGDNKPDAAQQTWLEEVGRVQANVARPDVVQVFLWYPADWVQIVEILR